MRDGFADQGGEGLFGQAAMLAEVNGAAGAGVAFGSEQAGGIGQLGAPGEGELDLVLIGLARADHAAVRPGGNACGVAGLFPLDLFHHRRIGGEDKGADMV